MFEEITKLWWSVTDANTWKFEDDTEKKVEINAYIPFDIQDDVLRQMFSIARSKKFGFNKAYPTIIIHCDCSSASKLIPIINEFDIYTPPIFVNIIIAEDKYKAENIISRLHTCYSH